MDRSSGESNLRKDWPLESQPRTKDQSYSKHAYCCSQCKRGVATRLWIQYKYVGATAKITSNHSKSKTKSSAARSPTFSTSDNALLFNVHISPVPLSQLHLIPALGTKLDAGAGCLPVVIITHLDNIHIPILPSKGRLSALPVPRIDG